MKKLTLIAVAALVAGAAQAVSPQEEKQFYAAAGLMHAIKQNLRDPLSVVWEAALVSKDGKTLCVQYRAQNGFGGMTREIVVMTEKKASTKQSFWDKHCLKNMDNFIHARNALM